MPPNDRQRDSYTHKAIPVILSENHLAFDICRPYPPQFPHHTQTELS